MKYHCFTTYYIVIWSHVYLNLFVFCYFIPLDLFLKFHSQRQPPGKKYQDHHGNMEKSHWFSVIPPSFTPKTVRWSQGLSGFIDSVDFRGRWWSERSQNSQQRISGDLAVLHQSAGSFGRVVPHLKSLFGIWRGVFFWREKHTSCWVTCWV